MADQAESELRERALADACEMVAEIVGNRARGARSETGGSSDNDLLAAVEDVESNIERWRKGGLS